MYSNFNRVRDTKKGSDKKLIFCFYKINIEFPIRVQRRERSRDADLIVVQRKRTTNPNFPSDPQKAQRSETHIYNTKPIQKPKLSPPNYKLKKKKKINSEAFKFTESFVVINHYDGSPITIT